MRVTRRTFLSSGVCAAAAVIPSSAFAEAVGQQPLRVSLVAANRTRSLDVAEIFQELGLAVDLISESELSTLSPEKIGAPVDCRFHLPGSLGNLIQPTVCH